MKVRLYSLRDDTDFDRGGAGPTIYKCWLDDEQSSDVHGVAGASGSFHSVFQQAKASVDVALEKRISEGEGNLRFEMIIPMLKKSIDLTDEEIKQPLEEGESYCVFKLYWEPGQLELSRRLVPQSKSSLVK